MGRAKKRFRNRLYKQASFSGSPIGRSVLQGPQRLLSQTAAEAETLGEAHEEQELAGKLLQPVLEQSAQTLRPRDMKENELELDGILRARSLFRELESQAKDDEPSVVPKYGQYGQFEEELDSCSKENAHSAVSYVGTIQEECAAT